MTTKNKVISGLVLSAILASGLFAAADMDKKGEGKRGDSQCMMKDDKMQKMHKMEDHKGGMFHLFKELNLKDEKALQQRIEEIQSANKLHMNTNTTGITAEGLSKVFDETFKSTKEGLGFFNYTVFPYTLMIDLGAAGLNFYSFGKNITQDIKDRKEKNEILKAVSDELSTFDINNLVNKTDNKAILELNEKAKKEGKDLSTIINDYTNEDFEKKLKYLFESYE